MLQISIISFLCIPSFICFDCSLPKDTGNSCNETPSSRQFYFDSRMKVCQPFQFNGCSGNANRFSTLKECKESCQSGSKTKTSAVVTNQSNSTNPNEPAFAPVGNRHEQWRKAEICGGEYLIPNGKYILCSPSTSCPKNHACVNGACCPSKDYVCSLSDDTGNGQDGIEDRPRFAWNHDAQSCVRYSYYGANGNYNNFPNFQSCIKYCRGSQKVSLT